MDEYEIFLRGSLAGTVAGASVESSPPAFSAAGAPNEPFVFTDDTPGTRTFTVPAGVTRLLIEAWGGGGGGSSGGRGLAAASGGGGGGGAYGRIIRDVTPEEEIEYNVGLGGSPGASVNVDGDGEVGTSGGWSGLTDTTLDVQGGSGADPFNIGGAGGDAFITIGDIKYAGGQGGSNTVPSNLGSGGGACASDYADGATGSNDAAPGGVGTGGAGSGGAGGGAAGAAGSDGVQPGGGGGGGSRNNGAPSGDGGFGGTGRVRFSAV